jgi:hypothetical protein
MWVINLPTKVNMRRKKKDKFFPINLNAYRNASFHLLDDAKKFFQEDITPQVKSLPKLSQVKITYVYFKPTLTMVDLANVCSIADKFFADSLVNLGVIEDDNHDVIADIQFVYGGISKENPRIEARIEHIGDLPPMEPERKEDEDMKLEMGQTEITEAVTNHIRDMMSVADDAVIYMTFSAKRTGEGLTASVHILPAGSEVPTDGKKAPATGQKRGPRKAKAQAAVPATTEAAPKAPVPETAAAVEEAPTETETPVAEAVQEAAPAEPVEEVQTAQEEAPAEEAPAAPKQSLFSGMTKPKND